MVLENPDKQMPSDYRHCKYKGTSSNVYLYFKTTPVNRHTRCEGCERQSVLNILVLYKFNGIMVLHRYTTVLIACVESKG